MIYRRVVNEKVPITARNDTLSLVNVIPVINPRRCLVPRLHLARNIRVNIIIAKRRNHTPNTSGKKTRVLTRSFFRLNLTVTRVRQHFGVHQESKRLTMGVPVKKRLCWAKKRDFHMSIRPIGRRVLLFPLL